MSRSRPENIIRVEISLELTHRKHLIEEAKKHGFSIAQFSFYTELILEAGLNTPAHAFQNIPPRSEAVLFYLHLPNTLVREYELLAKRLKSQVSRGALMAVVLARYATKDLSSSVDGRVVNPALDDRVRVPLRLREIIIHRLQKIARQRLMSVHFLVEELLLEALDESSARIAPTEAHARIGQALRSTRQSFLVMLQRSLIKRLDDEAERLRYPTRTDLIEEVLLNAVDFELLMPEMLSPAPAQPPALRVIESLDT